MYAQPQGSVRSSRDAPVRIADKERGRERGSRHETHPKSRSRHKRDTE